ETGSESGSEIRVRDRSSGSGGVRDGDGNGNARDGERTPRSTSTRVAAQHPFETLDDFRSGAARQILEREQRGVLDRFARFLGRFGLEGRQRAARGEIERLEL